jgi:hypothetical protein
MVMAVFRRHLRVWVAAWLVFQVATLSAFVPRDCCEGHRPAAERSETCHEPPPPAHCATAGDEGTSCPMHGHHQQAADDQTVPQCTMRGSCDGPMAMLATVLSNNGILTRTFAFLPAADSSRLAASTGERLSSQLLPPDAPPPRA